MRSLGFTSLLLLAAILICGLAGWQLKQGNFDSLLGAPATPVGQRIYSSFTPDEVKHIQISVANTGASFSLQDTGWQASAPWTDRMDPRAAVGIINFTLGLRVEDLAPRGKIDKRKTGLDENAISIRLEDENHRPLAKYKMGRVTPWIAEVEGMAQPVPTVFIQPRDKSHKSHVYACTGDINSLFKDELKFLRDHRPFYFNPITQGERFDPEGAYVRRWVPEAASLPDRFVHRPWQAAANVLKEAGIALGNTYPGPIIDHAQARARALRAYGKIKVR